LILITLVGKDGGDLEPKFPGVLQKNFLTDSFPTLPPPEGLIVLGNPPFGKKSTLAISFVEKSFQYSDTVAFILPVQFKKWGTQKQLRWNAKLILDEACPSDSFLHNGKPYDVRCTFQIWTLKDTELPNLRLLTAPAIAHPSFTMKTYNCTSAYEYIFQVAFMNHRVH
jgi:hypothetical protein